MFQVLEVEATKAMALAFGSTVTLSQYSLNFSSFNSSRFRHRIASRQWLNLNHVSVGSQR